MIYLDSCFVLANTIKLPYSKLRKFYRIKAGLLTAMKNFEEAIKILIALDKHYDSIVVSEKLKNNSLSDHILVASNIARIYHLLGNNDMALENYHKSLKLITKFNKKLDHQSHVLKKIAVLYKEKNNYSEAYKYLMQSNEYSEKHFKTSSERNKGVLEIRDSYKKSLNEKEKELMSKNLILIKNEKAILRFKILILVISILLILGVFFIKYKIDKNNYKNETEAIKETALRTQQQLEYKNKELTTYALQLMERDDLLDKLIDFIDKDKSKKAKSLKVDRKQLIMNSWDEFEKRFVEVNAGFYERISLKFPDLTIGDLKYCALLKLNLRGKEISKLLSVTEKSVHMARYRIRKKFNLATDENLVEYLNNV
jgi:tetratricopeptide (TPR) repeat protein/DNA-binding CsgD family transcriptional regulator